MLSKISSKNQVVIPKGICAVFGLSKGDVLDFKVSGRKIVMEPKELVLRDKYPIVDLKAAEHVLAHGKSGKELVFRSGKDIIHFFKKRTKK